MAFVIMGGLVVAGLLVLVGMLMMLAAAFAESIVWGLACIFVPGALLFFAVTHWDEAKRGFFLWLGGILGIFVVAGAGMPMLSKTDGLPEDPSAGPAKPLPANKVTCPRTPPGEGFSSWCCTPSGWVMQAEQGCGTTYAPSETCDASRYGQAQIAGCSTLGAKKKHDPF